MPRRESANSLNWYYLTISNFGRGEREVRCIVNGIKKLMDFFQIWEKVLEQLYKRDTNEE